MLEKFIDWFSQKHLLVNLLFFGILAGGIITWYDISKEEYPDITFDNVRINTSYPGASAEEVDRLVTQEIEEYLQGIDGVDEIVSSSSLGRSSITVSLIRDHPNRKNAVNEIEDATRMARLPPEVEDEPNVREWKTSKKAVIDVCIYHKKYRSLDSKARALVQSYGRNLENQVLSLPSVSEVNRNDYYNTEMQILLDPGKLRQYNVSVTEVLSAIRNNNLRSPAGTLDSEWLKKEKSEKPVNTRQKKMSSGDIKITVNSELRSEKDLQELIIRGSFEGNIVKLRQLGKIQKTFERKSTITRINGFEMMRFTVVKSTRWGIIETVEQVKQTVETFRKNNLSGSDIEAILYDDESIGIRNRMRLVTSNGMLGFILILIFLFIFLDFKSGIWVALGIPFALSFTLFSIRFMGYSINNVTLAAVIIVLGMVVDDAIVVSENINRMRNEGIPTRTAAVKGTAYVFMPIIGSIVTTCAAFLPLFFMSGRMALMISFIPPVIFLMLGSSLFESLFILPSHMSYTLPAWLGNLFTGKKKKSAVKGRHWFMKIEEGYGRILEKLLHHKFLLLGVFLLILITAWYIFSEKMKYEMFPRDEVTTMFINGSIAYGSSKEDTARKVQEIEDLLIPHLGSNLEAIQSRISQGRWGRAARQNEFVLVLKLVPREERKYPSSKLQAEWEKQFNELKGFEELMFRSHHFGSSSGSKIEIRVQEEDTRRRNALADDLLAAMEGWAYYTNTEKEREFMDVEYQIRVKRDYMNRLSISPSTIATTLRTVVEGVTAYEIREDGEDIRYIVTVDPRYKNDISRIMNMPIENRASYLVPLKNIVNMEHTRSPNSITRIDFKRNTTVFAEMSPDSPYTPVESAIYFETNVFPALLAKYPTASLDYAGQVKDARESGNDFIYATLAVLLLIFMILALLFNSLLIRPLIIMLSIVFGLAGIIIFLYLHGLERFSFFNVVGALGLIGVVVNDAIVMVTKLDREFDNPAYGEGIISRTANIAKTRLRAVLLTTLTTVAGLMPTAYGILGYDAMLSDMMLTMAWGLIFGTLITLLLIPAVYSLVRTAGAAVGRTLSRLEQRGTSG